MNNRKQLIRNANCNFNYYYSNHYNKVMTTFNLLVQK